MSWDMSGGKGAGAAEAAASLEARLLAGKARAAAAAQSSAYSRVDKWAAWITVVGFAAALFVLARRKGWL